MKQRLFIGIIALIIVPTWVCAQSLPPDLMRGGMEGAGGNSVVCREASGKIQSAEVLDLYEGRLLHGLEYLESDMLWDIQGVNLMKNSGIGAANSISSIMELFNSVKDNLVYLPPGTSLNPVDDSGHAIKPGHGCRVEQTINYINDRRVLVNSEIWTALTETQKAALVLHEAVYRYLRYEGETNSMRVRHFVAHIVSGGGVQDVQVDESYKVLGFCGIDNESVPAFNIVRLVNPEGKAVLRFYFNRLNRTLLSSTYIELEQHLFFGGGTSVVDLLASIFGTSEDINLLIKGATQSTYEAGDSITLNVVGNVTGRASVLLSGVSSVNGARYEMMLKCDRRH